MMVLRLCVILCFVACMLLGTNKILAESVEIDVPIASTDDIKRLSLTDELIHLIGPNAETNFRYEIHSATRAKTNFVYFYLTHSELLIEPSSVTVLVDGEPLKSVSLAKKVEHLEVILPEHALTVGSHTLTLRFYGVLKEGICVPQESTSNWLTVQINSFLVIDGATNQITQTLSSYPSVYRGTAKAPVQVIIPQYASLQTEEAALRVANYLAQSSVKNSIEIVEEQVVKEIKNHFILLGAKEEFSTNWAKKLLKGQTHMNGLALEQHQVTNGGKSVNALLVTAATAADFDKIGVLTEDQFMQQLTGESLLIEKLPVKGATMTESISFKQLGLPDLMFSSVQTVTDTYFYYVPKARAEIIAPSITLHVAYSNLIASYEETARLDGEEFLGGKVELIVYINGVPHPVDIQELKTEKETTITVPFEPSILKDSQLMSVQIATNGLVMKNPCIATDQTKWLYLFNDSEIKLPITSNEQQQEITYSRFPFPFAERDTLLTIVLPNELRRDELLVLYEALTVNNQLPTIELVMAEDLAMEQLENSHVLFIGGPSQQPMLQEIETLVSYAEDIPQLIDYGFIQTATANFTFIQPNSWNPIYTMIVFDKMPNASSFLRKELLTFLRDTEEKSTVVVQMNSNQIFTNEQFVQQGEVKPTNEKESDPRSVIWFIAVIGLMLVIIMQILYLRKKKR